MLFDRPQADEMRAFWHHTDEVAWLQRIPVFSIVPPGIFHLCRRGFEDSTGHAHLGPRWDDMQDSTRHRKLKAPLVPPYVRRTFVIPGQSCHGCAIGCSHFQGVPDTAFVIWVRNSPVGNPAWQLVFTVLNLGCAREEFQRRSLRDAISCKRFEYLLWRYRVVRRGHQFGSVSRKSNSRIEDVSCILALIEPTRVFQQFKDRLSSESLDG